jgi:hypothetical protein
VYVGKEVDHSAELSSGMVLATQNKETSPPDLVGAALVEAAALEHRVVISFSGLLSA